MLRSNVMRKKDLFRMNMEFIRKLPIPKELKAQFSLSEKLISVKEKRDAEIKKVFTGESDKKLLIIGPCSADREDAVLDYVNRLAKVQEKIADKLILIPRIYTNKPRTTGIGYKGMLHQSDPTGRPDMLRGLMAIRRLHVTALAQTGFPARMKCCTRKIIAIWRMCFPM